MPEFLIDPNLLYIGLLAGLWIGVTAAYIPGTWIPETISFILLGASIVFMTFLPTNWVALLVLVLGVAAFLILPFAGKRYRQFAEVGLLGQALGSYFLFKDGLSISPILIGITLILAVAYNRLVLLPILKRQKDHNEYDESTQVLGVRGRVVKALDP
ncbi:MAG: hypothetical protein Q9P01_01800 [Anaerolineae bacterium]|nr:hypothetical protein [Anaerolineae bacterium]